MPTVKFPRAKRGSGITIDCAAIEAAIEELGIAGDIQFKWMNGRSTRGVHRRYVDGRHKITMSCYQRAPEDLSFTIWHELIHCVQKERLGSDEFRRQYRRYSYDRNPFEDECNHEAQMRCLVQPLAYREGWPAIPPLDTKEQS